MLKQSSLFGSVAHKHLVAEIVLAGVEGVPDVERVPLLYLRLPLLPLRDREPSTLQPGKIFSLLGRQSGLVGSELDSRPKDRKFESRLVSYK